MKASLYNLYVPTGKREEYIVYNTLTGSTFVVDEKALDAIRNIEDGVIDDNLIELLKRENILIDDNVDEKAIFSVRSNTLKYSSAKAYFTILSTYACNLACSYCYERYFFKREGEIRNESMNERISKRVIKFIENSIWERNYNSVSIIFFGGESLLNIDEVFKIIETLDPKLKDKNVKLKVHLVSNGTLLTKDIINRLSGYDVSFQITLAGPREIHDRKRIYRNGKGTYDDVMRALDLLERAKMRFLIRVDVDKENYRYTDDLLDDLKERFGKGLSVQFAPIVPGMDPDCPFTSSCLIGEELLTLPTLWELASQKGFEVVLNPLMRYVFCQYLTDHAYVIDPLADVYKCEGFVGIRKQKIGAIDVNGKLQVNYQYYDWMSIDPLEKVECRKCTLLPACGGGCPALAYDRHGTYHKTVCYTVKHVIGEQIRFQLRHMGILGNDT